MLVSAVDTAFCNSRYMKSEGITFKEMDIQFIPVEQKTCVLRVCPSCCNKLCLHSTGYQCLELPTQIHE